MRDIDMDPLSALTEYADNPPAPANVEPTMRNRATAPVGRRVPASERGVVGNLPGARSADKLLDESPEALLLGPDYRAQGQGIYE